jgi:hypothetical protein
VQRNWKLVNDGGKSYYVFQVNEKKTEDTVPAETLSEQIVDYARHLEMIV